MPVRGTPALARNGWPARTSGSRQQSAMVRAVNGHVWGFAEGVAGQAFAVVAGLAVAVAVGNTLPDFEPAILAFGVLAAPWLIGSGVPVYRHAEVGAAGVATGWLAVFAAVLLVVETTDDAGQAETLGYLLAGWFLVLVLEAIAAGIAMSIRRKASPPQAPVPVERRLRGRKYDSSATRHDGRAQARCAPAD